MNAPSILVAFVVALLGVFGAAVLVGGAVGPEPRRAEPARADSGHGAMAAVDQVRGLEVAEGGLRLALDTPELPRATTAPLRFRILDSGGAAVRDFDVEHTRRMHLIVVRRDLTGFQHLHPRLARDGTWSVAARLPAAGSYRVFADFARDGEPHTLASDLRVDGGAALESLPPAAAVATTGGYEVRLDARGARAGEEADLRFEVTRDGRPVATEPYLGAGGHLVALREGDLAFLHVHPADGGGARFETTLPTAGRYRLFLQFKAAGRVHTAAFTREVAR